MAGKPYGDPSPVCAIGFKPTENGVFNASSGPKTRKRRTNRKQDGKESFPGTTHSSMDQQHRTTFSALKDARSSYKTAIFMDSGFLVDTSSDVLGGEDLALAGGGGWVRGEGSNGSNIMLGRGWRR